MEEEKKQEKKLQELSFSDELSKQNYILAEKYSKEWEEKKVFETKKNEKQKYFITFPFPYLNGAPHIGHAYSSFRADVYAWYKRLKGYNVLFPQGFHATGEPILGIIERIKKNDENQISTLKKFGATEEDIKKFVESPKYIVEFFRKKWVEALKIAGYSIDWSRTFTTTDITPSFSKFIEWQYRKLYEKGYIVKGTHPVVWCSKCKSPTGDHDRLKGEGETIQEYDIILFETNIEGEKYYIPIATLRPETIFATTNLWISNVDYNIIEVEGKKWIVSEEATKKLLDQLYEKNYNMKIVGKINYKKLLGQKAKNPITREENYIFYSEFVDTDNATGIVMSVPSHAPYDYMALKEIKEGKINLDITIEEKKELQQKAEEAFKKIKNIIELEEIKTKEKTKIEKEDRKIQNSEYPNAEYYIKKYEIKSIKEKEKLDKATKEIYKAEFHKGKYIIKELEGLKGEEAKEKTRRILEEKKALYKMYETTGKVVCRCTTECHVKVLEDQWFLKYSDEEWKKKANECVKEMKMLPEEARQQFYNTIEWLDLKACARKSGLGTKLPFDKEWIVETLSDSTIYMAYYTIADYFNSKKLNSEEINDSLYDYIFYGEKTKLEEGLKKLLEEKKITEERKEELKKIYSELKENFEYFYPVDMRISAKDLIQNHLTFFIFHHVALFEKKHWPKGIAVNGYVNVEGEKMSKSKGNIIPFQNLIEKHGPDYVRINIVSSSEEMNDANWSEKTITGFKHRIKILEETIKLILEEKQQENNNFNYENLGIKEKVLLHYLEKNKLLGEENYEKLKFRTSTFYTFFETINELKEYLKLERKNLQVLKYYLEETIKMNIPLMPYTMQYFSKKLGLKDIYEQEYPEAKKEYYYEKAEETKKLVENIKKDLSNTIQLLKRKNKIVKKAKLYLAEKEYYKVLKEIKEGKTLKEIMEKEEYKKTQFIKNLPKQYGKLKSYDYNFNLEEEKKIIEEYKTMIEKDLNIKIEVKTEKDENYKTGMPGKPGIYLE